jgi:ABC-type glycerol-3-phosphate transport system substrate-binding protein
VAGDAGTTPTPQTQIGRREFLTKAVALGLSLPAASAGVAARAAAGIRVRDRSRPFEGVRLTFAKAPHGGSEKELFKKWLAPFEQETGATVAHTIVPWGSESSEYLLNYAGPAPFDVTYQVTQDLTGLGTRGALEDLAPYLQRADFASERTHLPDTFTRASSYEGKVYGLPFIVGTMVMFFNRRMLAEAGVSTVPRTTTELAVAARKTMGAPNVWGFWTGTTVKDFAWYWNLHNVHNFGGDIMSADLKRATLDSRPVLRATQYTVDMIRKYKVEPPPGRYIRPEAEALFKAQRIAFLIDEPALITPFKQEKLPFEWDFVMPVGPHGGRRTVFGTNGHWVMASKSKHKEAAWALIRFLSSVHFSREYNLAYAFIPVRDDVDVSRGDPLVAKNVRYASCCWQGLQTHPKISEVLDAYGQGLEAAVYGKASVPAAMAKAQRDAARRLRE